MKRRVMTLHPSASGFQTELIIRIRDSTINFVAKAGTNQKTPIYRVNMIMLSAEHQYNF